MYTHTYGFKFGWPAMVAAALTLVATLPALAQQQDEPLTLVADGEARAQIVVGPISAAPEQLAAQEFQHAIELISGVTLPIVAAQSEPAPMPVRIVLGTPETNSLIRWEFPDDMKFLKNNDGFAVRRDGDTLYIIGSQPKGVLNGVYDFLEDNTSILWFRAGPEGVAYQESSNVVAEKTDYRERPAFDVRGWHLTGIWRHTHDGTELWMTRNRCNYKPTDRPILERALPTLNRRGLYTPFSGGHNLKFWMPPERYAEEHPEYYAMVDGVRRPDSHRSQLCFSNQQMTDAFIERALNVVAELPPAINMIGIVQQDHTQLCECELCTSPIELPDGTTLQPGDEAFRSTQFFLFLNQIARAVGERYPDMQVNTLAYQFTAAPPKVEIPENVNIRFCPFPASAKHTMQHEINEKWLKYAQAWTKKTPNVVWREYYGCASHFPRSIAQTVQADLQHINSLGIHKVYSEGPPDSNKPRSGGRPLQSHAWDVSSMQFWLITRLWWNPDADLDALRQRYLNRVYQDAAPAMGQFYKLIRDSWYADSTAEYYNAEAENLARRYIQSAGIADACRAALEEAAQLAGNDRVAERVAAVQARFDGWMDAIAEHPTPTATLPTTDADVATVLDFDTPAWQDATVIDSFNVMGEPGTSSSERTKIHLLTDAQNLYVGVECFDADGQVTGRQPEGDYEQFPGGDRIEMFFVGDQKESGLYYQLAFNAVGAQYDGKGYNKSWNGDWSVTTRIDEDGWRAVAVVPWATLGVAPANGSTSALFYRLINAADPADSEHSSWGGGAVHSAASFGRLIHEAQ